MRIAIMQPYLFPYLGYFQLVQAVDKFVLLDDVHYINKGWINRNSILINGAKSNFTVPLENASQNRLIKDIHIAPVSGWQAKFLKTIELAYRRAPYFKQIFPLLEIQIKRDEKAISCFIYQSLLLVLAYLDVDTVLIESSVIYQNGHLKGQDKIIDICLQEKALEYINPSGGLDLYTDDKFQEKNLKLHFLKPHLPIYRQFEAEFVPGLSIIDVLMFNPKATVKNYLGAYELASRESRFYND